MRCKLSPLRAIFVLAVPALALFLSAGCTLSIPPGAPPPEATAQLSAQPDSQALCLPRYVDAEILQATWAYIHERYPAQPWPNDVYLVGDRGVTPPCQDQPIHVVLCSHATGFVWEGDIVWSWGCACCRVQVQDIRELYVAMPGWDAVPTVRP